MLAGEAPGGLGVPGEIDDRKRLAHFFVPGPSSWQRVLWRRLMRAAWRGRRVGVKLAAVLSWQRPREQPQLAATFSES